VPYSLIAALWLLGLILNIKKRKVLNLHIAILSQVAIMVIFYVLCRFRVPMVAMLAIFAGYALKEIIGYKSWKKSLRLGLVALVLWVVLLRPFPKIPTTYFKGDIVAYFYTYYLPKLDQRVAAKDLAGCTVLFEELISTMPYAIQHVDPAHGLSSSDERKMASYYGTIYNDLGDLYRDLGQTTQANACYIKRDLLKSVGED
jgi:hypothetical protein